MTSSDRLNQGTHRNWSLQFLGDLKFSILKLHHAAKWTNPHWMCAWALTAHFFTFPVLLLASLGTIVCFLCCVIMLSVIMLSVIMLSVIMLSVIMLSVFILSVVYTDCPFSECPYSECLLRWLSVFWESLCWVSWYLSLGLYKFYSIKNPHSYYLNYLISYNCV